MHIFDWQTHKSFHSHMEYFSCQDLVCSLEIIFQISFNVSKECVKLEVFTFLKIQYFGFKTIYLRDESSWDAIISQNN